MNQVFIVLFSNIKHKNYYNCNSLTGSLSSNSLNFNILQGVTTQIDQSIFQKYNAFKYLHPTLLP